MFGDWKLTYAGSEYLFGPPGRTVRLIDWDFASDSYQVDDVVLPRADGVAFGQDYVEPGELAIQVKIDYTDAPFSTEECARLAWAARGELARAWRADSLRGSPLALAELVMGGQQMIEGRPRRARFDDSHQNVGLVFADLFFIPSQVTAYVMDENGDAPWRSVTVGLVPPESGGWVFPFVFPLTTAIPAVRASSFTVDGDVPAWPVIEVSGPLQSGGQVELAGAWTLKLNRALAYDETVTVDTRPGRRSMSVNGRPGNVLDPAGSRLSRASLKPGSNQVALRGVSAEGTASVTVRWRDTKAGI